MAILPIQELWPTQDGGKWKVALHRYWEFIQPKNLELEREMDRLEREVVRKMSPDEWFSFLENKYFRWKYTAANRYATTTSHLKHKGGTDDGRLELYQIKSQILDINPENICASIALATRIPGLGVAGASGLLALLYPESFGTVDQFVVRALREIPSLPEASAIAHMKPEGLQPKDGAVLIQIMRGQALHLTNALGEKWRPRDVDKVLWTYGR